jgi:hypothetical protein
MENFIENKNIDSKLKRELTSAIDSIFTNAKDQDERRKNLNKLISKLNPFFNLISEDNSQIIESIKVCAEIEDKDVFTERILSILEPLIKIETADPKAFEEKRREFFVDDIGSTKLNEILSYEIDNDVIHLHLSPAREFIKEKGIPGFIKEIRDGFISLAKILEENKEIKDVVGISWIIAKNPTLLEGLGFSVEHGKIPNENNPEGGERPISIASISREKFLERYHRTG